jgi:hypothetical protein
LLPLLSKTSFCNLNLDLCKTRLSYLFLCCKLYYVCHVVLLGITMCDVTRRVSWRSGSSPSRRLFCHKLQFEKSGSIVQTLKNGVKGAIAIENRVSHSIVPKKYGHSRFSGTKLLINKNYMWLHTRISGWGGLVAPLRSRVWFPVGANLRIGVKKSSRLSPRQSTALRTDSSLSHGAMMPLCKGGTEVRWIFSTYVRRSSS